MEKDLFGVFLSLLARSPAGAGFANPGPAGSPKFFFTH